MGGAVEELVERKGDFEIRLLAREHATRTERGLARFLTLWKDADPDVTILKASQG